MTVFSIHPAFLRCFSAGLLVAIFVSIQPLSVQAQTIDTQALLDRIQRLERDIRTLNRQIANVPGPQVAAATEGTAASPAMAALESTSGEGPLTRVMVRVAGLEDEVRNATGLAESMAHNIDLANARLDKLIVDLDYRLARLEGTAPGALQSSVNNATDMPKVSRAPSTHAVSKAGVMAPPTEAAPAYTTPNMGTGQGVLGTLPKSTLEKIVSQGEEKSAKQTSGQAGISTLQTPTLEAPAPQISALPTPQPGAAEVVPQVSIADQYKAAFNLTRQARYQEAEIAFKAFIQANGEDPLVGNARYWLGETYYVRENFMEAAQVFFQAYKQFPKGIKASDSLLKLGMSMAALDKKSEACATFGKLRKEFGADLKTNIKRALNKETKRLACK
ncbi:MAG: tol-pal system protein YbgF [Magnetovibrio sp.]|nr:tol-pal system protein YbgF [Magnetovibrio sp.]